MNCPVCISAKLVITERQGIEIDYCPACRGVWLDRGELDKIIDRSSTRPPESMARTEAYAQHQSAHPKKKREGFLSDLFDFD